MSASNTISDSCRLASPAPTWPLATTPPSKLRDSCHACAVSKVKCHREKPSCSRCVKRGTVCAYVTTRRGGRKKSVVTQKDATGSDKASPRYLGIVNTSQPTQPSQLESSAESTATNIEFMQPEGLENHPSPQFDIPADLNFTLFTNLFGPEEHSLSPLLTDLLTDSGSFDIPSNVQETSATDAFSDTSLFGPSAVEDSSTAPDTTSEGFASTIAVLNHPGNAVATSNGEPRCWQDSQSEEKSCCSCLARALGLMRSLFPNETTSGDGTPPTVQSIIENNKQVLEATSAMMQCSCSDDGYLLAITSLIISKVLGWYHTAARKMSIPPSNHDKSLASSSWPTPSSNKSQETTGSVVVGGYCLDGEDQDRMKAQLVLGELHRVQSLVNQLGIKLRLLAEKKRDVTSGAGGYMEVEKMPSISALVVDQVGTDLRNRLQWLSKNIIQRLNRE
ncbi:aflatoxin regulatory protein-domain-containing protein [Hypoxylon sp. NC0597]|nr:aflatoxin regulatory protein-domain-containing protein [Hypoxylon sp. NC0597]